MTFWVTEPYANRKGKYKVPVKLYAAYQNGGTLHDPGLLQNLVDGHPDAIYFTDDPEVDVPMWTSMVTESMETTYEVWERDRLNPEAPPRMTIKNLKRAEAARAVLTNNHAERDRKRYHYFRVRATTTTKFEEV